MPLYCSNTGSTALREAEVQQPMTEATLSLTRSFFAFSAKVGQSLPPSSWMNLILRPSTPPCALICSMASFSACTEPVSLIAMVPVTECKNADGDLGVGHRQAGRIDLRPSETAAPAPSATSIAVADSAAAPTRSSRRVGVESAGNAFRDDMRRLLSSLVDRGESRSPWLARLRRFVAMQHTSIDVYAYVGCRIKMR